MSQSTRSNLLSKANGIKYLVPDTDLVLEFSRLSDAVIPPSNFRAWQQQSIHDITLLAIEKGGFWVKVTSDSLPNSDLNLVFEGKDNPSPGPLTYGMMFESLPGIGENIAKPELEYHELNIVIYELKRRWSGEHHKVVGTAKLFRTGTEAGGYRNETEVYQMPEAMS